MNAAERIDLLHVANSMGITVLGLDGTTRPARLYGIRLIHPMLEVEDSFAWIRIPVSWAFVRAVATGKRTQYKVKPFRPPYKSVASAGVFVDDGEQGTSDDSSTAREVAAVHWDEQDGTWVSSNGRWQVAPKTHKGRKKPLYQLTDMHRKHSVGLYVTPQEAMDRASF